MNFANAPIPADETPESIRAESLRMLGELAQVGMAIAQSLQELAALELARGMQAQTAWTPPGAAPARPGKSDNDIGLSYQRVAKAVRLTLAMRLRLVSEPAPEAAAPRAPVDPEAARDARRRRWNTIGKDIVRQGVERAIAAEARGERAESLYAELHEKLEDPDELAELDGLGFSQIIVKICNDLGVGPRAKLAARREMAREAEARPDPLASSPAIVPQTQSVTPGHAQPHPAVNRNVHGAGRGVVVRGWRGDDGSADGPDDEAEPAANDNPNDRPP